MAAWAAVLPALVAASCNQSTNPDDVANRFVDAYYLEFDFNRAAALAESEARTRVEHDAKEVEQVRQLGAFERSNVYYGKPERRALSADLVHYTFTLDVRLGDEHFERKILLIVAKRGTSEWRVIGFRELGERVGESSADPNLGVRTTTAPR
jgi:hypothetical protein